MFSSRGTPFVFALRLAVFVLLFIALAEVWLRVVTPASDPPFDAQDAATKVWRYEPSGSRGGLWTVGRLARRAGHWRINNAGYNCAVDYPVARPRKQPLIALFGDSYIEGLLTDTDQHIEAYLPSYVRGGCYAYAFGVSAASLAQCVAMSQYDAARYRPDVLVVLIGARAVADSLQELGTPSPYFFQIRKNGDGYTDVPPSTTYAVSRTARLARASKIVCYLRFNAHVSLPGEKGQEVAVPVAGNGGAGQSGAAVRELLPGARYLVRRLCVENPGTPIVFMYQEQAERYLGLRELAGAPLSPDAQAVKEASRGHGQCHFLDLRYAFARDWAAHHRRFEAVDGGHWNAYANRLVARTLAEFIDERALLTPETRTGGS